MTLSEKIIFDEAHYNRFIQSCVKRICSDSETNLILIAGPSCSGKTTTTHKLSEELIRAGKQTYTISIDDFYKSPEEMPKKANGKPDFEDIESFDIETLHKCLQELANGEYADIPHFDFPSEKRIGIRCTIKLDTDSIAIIEGLHALNPIIYKNFVSDDKVFRIFLDCHTDSVSKMRYSRLMRRLVRDYHFRNADAQKTFTLWDNVLSGEKKYIYPYEHLADMNINTRFSYEPGVLRNSVIRILRELPKHSIYSDSANVMINYLMDIPPIPQELIPQDSLLHEFIG